MENAEEKEFPVGIILPPNSNPNPTPTAKIPDGPPQNCIEQHAMELSVHAGLFQV